MGWFGPSEDFAGLGCRKDILRETWMYCSFLEADKGEENERKDRDELWKCEVYDENDKLGKLKVRFAENTPAVKMLC